MLMVLGQSYPLARLQLLLGGQMRFLSTFMLLTNHTIKCLGYLVLFRQPTLGTGDGCVTDDRRVAQATELH